MPRTLLVLLVLFAANSSPAEAKSHFQLWKVYAGKTDFDYYRRPGEPLVREGSEVGRQASRNAYNNVVLKNTTNLVCERGMQFGVGFYIKPQHSNFVSFDRVWYYPHLEGIRGSDRETKSVVHRKSPRERYGLRFLVLRLKDEDLIDGSITLLLQNDEHVFLRHTFEIRGCDLLK